MADEIKDTPEQTPPTEQQAQQPAAEAPPQPTEEAAQEPVKPDLPPNKVTIEDMAEAKKKVTVEIDRERIDAKFAEMFGELHQSALVPGFRKGHAPRRLLEKRFGKEVGQDVRNAVVSEALMAAIEEHKLEIIGEPDLDLEKIELPPTGNLTFSVDVEVRPQFTLPDYKGIVVTAPQNQATEEQVQEMVKALLASRGTLETVAGAAEKNDLITADITLTIDGHQEHSHQDQKLRVAPAALEGVPLEQLGDQLTGATAGQTVQVQAPVPQGHPTEAWRGKTAVFDIQVKQVQRLRVPELTDELAKESGLDSAEQFRQLVRQQLQERLERGARDQMRDQVGRYLLEHTQMELPPALAQRHAAQVLQRRAMQMLYQGVPREQLEQNLELLKAQAGEQARTDLKLTFILGQIAEEEEITVDEGEVNARVAAMARQQNRRPERLRSELSADGSLEQLQMQLLEERTLERVLEYAKVTDAQPAAGGQPAPAEGAAPAEGGQK